MPRCTFILTRIKRMSKINLEEFFISCLGTVEDLQRDLNSNLNLVDIADKKILALVNIVLAFIPKHQKEEMFEDVTSETILDLLKKERPDLYSIVIQHPIGKEWIGRQIEILRKRFL